MMIEQFIGMCLGSALLSLFIMAFAVNAARLVKEAVDQ